MVFVKVRETYDLHTVKEKMTVIGIHTPKPDIIKANFPGLLMQCKAYRPVAADVRIACASTLPLDPLGVGTSEGDVAPEDLFNPILYKACSNFGMSQIESRIVGMSTAPSSAIGAAGLDVDGKTASVDADSLTTVTDEFPIYYGLLSNAHEWRHANPQQGLEMNNLKPLVYEVLYNVGDMRLNPSSGLTQQFAIPMADGSPAYVAPQAIRGNSKPLPFINCTSYTGSVNLCKPGFNVPESDAPNGRLSVAEQDVPWINCVVGCIIVPPSRLHELFYRMVVEWTIEFSSIRPISEITNWTNLGLVGDLTHYQNYDYSNTKRVLTGSDETVLNHDQCMVSANVDVNKVM